MAHFQQFRKYCSEYRLFGYGTRTHLDGAFWNDYTAFYLCYEENAGITDHMEYFRRRLSFSDTRGIDNALIAAGYIIEEHKFNPEFMTEELCLMALRKYPSYLHYIPEQHRTLEMIGFASENHLVAPEKPYDI
jgi:hypothetical protein